MHLYFGYFLMSLKSQIQYRVSFLLTTLGQFIAAFAAVVGISFMFSRFNSVDGFTRDQVLLCYAIVLMAFTPAEMMGSGFCRLAGMLGNGEFDRTLVRPRNVIVQVLFGKMDFTRLGLLIQALLVFCYAIFNGVVVWTWDKILLLCLMIICGCVVFFSLFLVNATFAFFTFEGLEIMNIFTYGGRQFGRYPFSIYGKGVLTVLTYVVPLALFQYYPLLYLLDKEKNISFMFTPLFGLLFLIPCYAFFRMGLRHYKSTGS